MAIEEKEYERIGKTYSSKFCYKLEEVIGKGGVNIVYKASYIDKNNNKKYAAIKFLASEHEQKGKKWIEEVQRLFDREIEVLNVCKDNNIIEIIEHGEYNSDRYIATEYLDGISLDKGLDKGLGASTLGKPSLSKIISAVIDILNALKCLHNKNYIHRDIKPANIFLLESGGVKLLDFNIAHCTSGGSESISFRVELDRPLGTDAYLAPEQIKRHEESLQRKTGDQLSGYLSSKTDMYSLGLVFYEMIVNRKFRERLDDIRNEKYKEVINIDIFSVYNISLEAKERLVVILTKLVQKEPIDRYEKAQDVIKELKSLNEDIKKVEENEYIKKVEEKAFNLSKCITIITVITVISFLSAIISLLFVFVINNTSLSNDCQKDREISDKIAGSLLENKNFINDVIQKDWDSIDEIKKFHFNPLLNKIENISISGGNKSKLESSGAICREILHPFGSTGSFLCVKLHCSLPERRSSSSLDIVLLIENIVIFCLCLVSLRTIFFKTPDGVSGKILEFRKKG